MSIPIFTLGSAAYKLYGSAQTGVLGVGDFMSALAKIGPKMWVRAHKIDTNALDEMVTVAKGRAPEQTGRLVNGITGRVEDEVCIFEASAISPDGYHEDYARDVEFGHHAGHVMVADDAYFATTGSASFGRGDDTFVESEPFFFNSADEALEKRGVAMDSVLAGVAAEDGWQTQ